jgi:beta-galactosidase
MIIFKCFLPAISSVMKRFYFLFLILILFSCNELSEEKESPRSANLFNNDWLFHRGEVASAEIVSFDDRSWRKLSLPHDWSIEDIPGTESPLDPDAIGEVSSGFFVGGTSWYRKHFHLEKHQLGKRIYLQFDGIYMNADIWLNGNHLGNHPYGYTTFGYDITDLVKSNEENIIAVEVKNEGKNSRWYSGSGIYRHVWLICTENVYVPTWGVFITTPVVRKDSAGIKANIQVVNDSDANQKITVHSRIFNSDGVMRSQTKNTVDIPSNGRTELAQKFEIEDPRLWSPDEPNLYRMKTQLAIDGKVVDEVEHTFGIRTIAFDVDNGFRLNDEPILLKGGCMHHGNGPLGASAYDRAEERRVELMKKSGFNAIRCSHNPPSEAFLNACDRLGIMVIDEAFDMWKKPKNPQDYHLYFDDWWQKDVEAMVLRDRNHPSIIMWSTGNEIPERGEPEGVERSIMLRDFIKNIDPTRPVTAAVNGLNPGKDPYFATLDISGYNYATGGDHWKTNIYQLDHQRVPDRIIYGAESYPLEAFGAWMDVLDNTFVIGDFVWTGFDYLGEASIGWLGYMQKKEFYPWSHAYCGDIDICGWKRPQSYYRDILWEVGDKPYVFVVPPKPSFELNPEKMDWSKWEWHDVVDSWNWEGHEGEQLEVHVYNRSESVELLLNDKSLGKKETTRTNEWTAKWKVPYEKGVLKAVNFRNGSELSSDQLITANAPLSIKLDADRISLKADGFDLSYIEVSLVDENGVRNPTIEQRVDFELEGPGEILAVASSNPRSTESYRKPYRNTFQGRCLLVVKSHVEAGEIVVTARSADLPEATISIMTN